MIMLKKPEDEVQLCVGDTVRHVCAVPRLCENAWKHKQDWIVTKAYPMVRGRRSYEITTERVGRNEDGEETRKLVTAIEPEARLVLVDSTTW